MTRDAMPEGGKLAIRTANVPATDAASLNVSGMPPADYVLVEVSDTGSGMSADSCPSPSACGNWWRP